MNDLNILQRSSDCWRPIVLQGDERENADRLEELRRHHRIWRLHDTLQKQIRDLFLAEHPQTKKQSVTSEMLASYRQGLEKTLDGEIDRWVHYPWSGVTVRLLEPSLFSKLRLDRNRNKITDCEQHRLAQLKIGVIGLSVGNAIANTLALEGLFGQIRIADYDTIDLSNMNRLRVGVHQIGVKKTVIAARQIFEINPYADVMIFSEGINETNLESFLCADQKLNILIEECDDIRLKYQIREMARKHRVPVIMETSDRGMIDVERYDLEPNRPLFHGLSGDVCTAEIPTQLSNDDKVAYALPILGASTVTARMAASMVEIEETLSTWPQLGSEVALGGASVAAAVRRIGLGQPMQSGRRFIDLQAAMEAQPENVSPPNTSRYESVCRPKHDTRDDSITTLVKMACLAPSGGNCQPWKFYRADHQFWINLDPIRAKNRFDPHHRGALIAIGAAIRNIEITAAYQGLSLIPIETRQLNAIAGFRVDRGNVSRQHEAQWFPCIEQRVTNRNNGHGKPIRRLQMQAMSDLISRYACRLRWIDNRDQLDELGEILGECDRIRFLNQQLHAELISEVRWTEEDVRNRRDGLDLKSLALSPSQSAGLEMLKRTDVVQSIRAVGGGASLKSMSRDAVNAASAIGLISVNSACRESVVRCGKAIQQLWLYATREQLAIHPMTAGIYMFEVADDSALFCESERDLLKRLENRLEKQFPRTGSETPLMLFRISHGVARPSRRSLRRDLGDVLIHGEPDQGGSR